MKEMLDNRVVNDIFRRSLTGAPSYLILWTLIIFPTGFYQKHPVISMALFCVFFITTLLRLIPFFGLKFFNWNLEYLNKNILFLGMIVQGSIWSGAFVYIMWAPLPEYMKMFMVICTAGLCAGGGLTYSPLRPLALSYAALLLLPCSFYLVFSGKEDALSLALVFMVFMIYIAVLICKGNQEYHNALKNEQELEKKTQELERLSQTDNLTGLFSRRYFEQVYTTEWKRSVREKIPISVLMVDIDHFKRVNDTYGHIAGDQALREFACELQAVFRRCSDVVSRFGGEEFAILLPNTNLENAHDRAEVLRSRIENMIIIHRGKTIRITVSVGISGRDFPGLESSQDIIAEADEALYRAKESGRNQVQVQEVRYQEMVIPAEQYDLFAENY